MSGTQGTGRWIAGAAALAVEQVNADKTLLPGHMLEYSSADSGCSAQQGLEALGQLLGGESRIDAVIGPGCNAACEVTSYLSSGQKIPQISYSCTSPTLSDKTKFALFSRTVASDTSIGPALLAMMMHYKWTDIVMLTSTDAVYITSGLWLTKLLEASGMKVFKPAAFEPGASKDGSLSAIKREGIRIVMLLTYAADRNSVASSAQQAGMNGPGWAWLLPDHTSAGNNGQMQGWLYPRPLLTFEGVQTFVEQVSKQTAFDFNTTVAANAVDFVHSATLFDAILLYAHAATQVLLESGELHNGSAVAEATRSTTFEGAGSSSVVIDARGDRVVSYMR